MNVWCAASLKFELPDVADWFAPFALESFAPQDHVPLHAGPVGGDAFPVARVGQGYHRRHAAALHQWRVVELGEGAAHRGTRLAGPFGDLSAWRIGHVTTRLNAIHLGRYVEPVTVDCPLRCLLRTHRTRPAEADYTGADRDPESAGLRFLRRAGPARAPMAVPAQTVPRPRPPARGAGTGAPGHPRPIAPRQRRPLRCRGHFWHI